MACFEIHICMLGDSPGAHEKRREFASTHKRVFHDTITHPASFVCTCRWTYMRDRVFLCVRAYYNPCWQGYPDVTGVSSTRALFF
jgi:hypothetical protein